MQQLLFMMPLMMYAGSGRELLTYEGKRSIVKTSQVQELVLHTIPLGALVWYNNSTEVEVDESLDLALKILLILSLLLNAVELVLFNFFKASGQNIEISPHNGR